MRAMSLVDVSSDARALPDPRSRILAAAGEIFLKEGFAGTTVDAVAALARMSKESIYDRFPTKSALFEAAVRASIDKYTYGEPDEGPAEKVDDLLLHMGTTMFDRFADPVNFGLFRNNIEAANHFPDLASALHEHRRQASQANAVHLQAWLDNGHLLSTSAIDTVIRFSSMCIGGSRYFLGKPLPTHGRRKQLVQRTVALFLDGYATVTSGERPFAPPAQLPLQGPATSVRMSAARIDEMLAAIEDEFIHHGYRAASIDRAVSAVKVGKTTVYRQFGNKEGVFRRIVQRRIEAELTKTYDLPADSGSFTDALTSLATQVLKEHCESANIRLQRLLIQEAEHVPELASAFYDARTYALGNALSALAEKFHAPVPDQFAVEDFHTLATSALRYLTVEERPGTESFAAEAREACNIFVHGVRGGGKS